MDIEKNKLDVINEIKKLSSLWRRMANMFNFGIVILGITTITTSIFLSVYTGSKLVSDSTLKLVAYVSTTSLTLLTAFNLISYSNNSRKAWRSLNSAIMKYESGIYSIEQLIDTYQTGEDTMGTVDFNYGTNTTNDVINQDKKIEKVVLKVEGDKSQETES